MGGCSLILAPDVSMIHLSNMSFFSPEGRCYTFDERANGYAKGEGAGFVVIKLLAEAIADGDTIRAVIRATGTNQDGKTPGLTQPSNLAQEQNIRNTYLSGGLDTLETQYFVSKLHPCKMQDPRSDRLVLLGSPWNRNANWRSHRGSSDSRCFPESCRCSALCGRRETQHWTSRSREWSRELNQKYHDP